MKLYGRWRVSLPGGETYLWEPDDVTVGEEVMILGELDGVDDYERWIQLVDKRAAIPCQVLVWFLRRKAGQQIDRAGVIIAHRRIETEPIEEPPLDPEASAGSAADGAPSGPAS